MDPEEELSNLVIDGRNRMSVACCSCDSIIFRPQTARFVQKEVLLPVMERKSLNEANTKCDRVIGCWVVDDMYAFENIGFSHTVRQTKYLACADCEVGPVGWHDIRNPKEFFIALSRVNHKLQ